MCQLFTATLTNSPQKFKFSVAHLGPLPGSQGRSRGVGRAVRLSGGSGEEPTAASCRTLEASSVEPPQGRVPRVPLAGGRGLSNPRGSCITRLIGRLPASSGGPRPSRPADFPSVAPPSSPSAPCRTCLRIPGENDSALFRASVARRAPLERSRKAPLCQGPCASLEPRSPFAAECAHAHVPDIRSRTRLSCPPPTTHGDGSTWLSDSSFEPETSGMKIFPKCEIFQTRILKRCESRGKCTSKANDLSLASFSPTEVKNYSSAACVGVVAVPRRVWTVPLALFAQCSRFARLLTRGSTTTATSRPRDRLVHIDWCGNELLSFSWVS